MYFHQSCIQSGIKSASSEFGHHPSNDLPREQSPRNDDSDGHAVVANSNMTNARDTLKVPHGSVTTSERRRRSQILTTVARGVVKTVDKGSRWTGGCARRAIVNIPANWPRIYSFAIGILFPLWLLIGVSVVLGFYLAKAEAPGEIASNDSILSARMKMLMKDALETDAIEWNVTSLVAIRATNSARRRNLEATQDAKVSLDAYFDVDILSIFDEVSEAYNSLTFNWIRCWDEDEIDLHRVFQPNIKQIEHARYESQLAYYTKAWKDDHSALYEQYTADYDDLDQNIQLLAFDRASAEATGSVGCRENYAGASWFWFTVMTTVGYGNQAPSSQGGRAMIWTAGFLSILLFAGVLGFSGFIFSSIFEDMMSRIHLRFLKFPLVGCLLWGTSWYAWIVVLAGSVDKFWTRRLGDPSYASRGETLWFAYISTATVGLGDFFPQPEVIFLVDVVTFSLEFLVGFVLLSSFLAKFGELLSSLAPNIGSRLPERLQKSHFLTCKPADFGFKSNFGEAERLKPDRRITDLKRLLREHCAENSIQDQETRYLDGAIDDDENLEPTVTTIDVYEKTLRREEELLQQLLQTVQHKLEQRQEDRHSEDHQPKKKPIENSKEERKKKLKRLRRERRRQQQKG